jgi:hypothetical protein
LGHHPIQIRQPLPLGLRDQLTGHVGCGLAAQVEHQRNDPRTHDDSQNGQTSFRHGRITS